MENLTYDQRSAAYTAVKERFGLRHQQRTALDTSVLYPAIMRAAHAEDWTTVEELLFDAGITR